MDKQQELREAVAKVLYEEFSAKITPWDKLARPLKTNWRIRAKPILALLPPQGEPAAPAPKNSKEGTSLETAWKMMEHKGPHYPTCSSMLGEHECDCGYKAIHALVLANTPAAPQPVPEGVLEAAKTAVGLYFDEKADGTSRWNAMCKFKAALAAAQTPKLTTAELLDVLWVAHRDIGEWVAQAAYFRKNNEDVHTLAGSPTQIGIDASNAVRGRIMETIRVLTPSISQPPTDQDKK